MTIEELYNKIIEQYPKFKDYIIYDASALSVEIYVTDRHEYQRENTMFFLIIGQKKMDLYRALWTKDDFDAPAKLNTSMPSLNHHTETQVSNQLGSTIFSILTKYWSDYEASVQYFRQVFNELPNVDSLLSSLGFKESDLRYSDMAFETDLIEISIEYPNLHHLTYTLYVHTSVEDEAKDHLVLFCESKNIKDCIECLLEEK